MLQHRVQLLHVLFFLVAAHGAFGIVVVLVLPLVPEHLIVQFLLGLLPPRSRNARQIAHPQYAQLVLPPAIGLASHDHGDRVREPRAMIPEVTIRNDVEREGRPFGGERVVHLVRGLVHFEGRVAGVACQEGIIRFYLRRLIRVVHVYDGNTRFGLLLLRDGLLVAGGHRLCVLLVFLIAARFVHVLVTLVVAILVDVLVRILAS
mmetsp:Transcript_6964/g.17222  ORF Transcript_6964/g.17222 Transcript_6964/m.17222 type:complete len:205 (+) Transcript_6964:163-777(+)